MIKTFKALSALLSYPTTELQEAAPELGAFFKAEALIPEGSRRKLETLIALIADGDIYDLQEQYVLQFDRTRSLSLHLFEHVHGEGRERGQALVDLQQVYERGGMVIDARELPDYLPLFLEFLSTLPLSEARELLREPLHIIAALGERLARRDSDYASIARALVSIAEHAPESDAVAELLKIPDDNPDDLEALDQVWEEAAIEFGPGADNADSCPQVSDMLQRMGIPDAAPDPTPDPERSPSNG